MRTCSQRKIKTLRDVKGRFAARDTIGKKGLLIDQDCLMISFKKNGVLTATILIRVDCSDLTRFSNPDNRLSTKGVQRMIYRWTEKGILPLLAISC